MVSLFGDEGIGGAFGSSVTARGGGELDHHGLCHSRTERWRLDDRGVGPLQAAAYPLQGVSVAGRDHRLGGLPDSGHCGAGAFQTVSPVTAADGSPIPLFQPDLWSFWMPFLIAVLAVEVASELVKYRTGHWTWALASVNLALNALFSVPTISC